MTGFIYDKIHDKRNADYYYLKALEKYNDEISKKPNEVRSYNNRLVIIYLIYGRETGKLELDNLKIKFKDDQSVLLMEDIFINFNRSSFIDGLF